MKDPAMKKGFTLIEILVVIGILATLMGIMAFTLGGAKDDGEKAKVRTLVVDTATALKTVKVRNNGTWPKTILTHNNQQLDEKTATVFARTGLLGMAFKESGGSIVLQGADRCGIVDHWGAAALKKSSSTQGSGDSSLKVGNGASGTVKDHLLWYAVDEDGDGITEINAEGIGSIKVRAEACVWAAGKDGKVASYSDVGRSDDIHSWTPGQVKK